MLTADVSASSYLLPPTEGLTAGATPEGPTAGGAPATPAPDPGAPATTTTADDLWSLPMSVINDTWRFLVQRKLWPLAILLIAAAVAVPMLLAEEPPRRPPLRPSTVKGDQAAVLATEPIVAPAADGDRSGRRRSSARARTPSSRRSRRPRRRSRWSPSRTRRCEKTAPAKGGAPTRGRLARAGHDRPGRAADPIEKKKYELQELTVRFGPSSETTAPPRKDVKRLQALPSSDEPVLIYLGLLDDKKTAVFLLDSGVIAQGDGTCRPTRTTCETIHIKAGETRVLRRALRGWRGHGGGRGRHAVPARRRHDPQDEHDERQEGQALAGARLRVRPQDRACPGHRATGRCATATTPSRAAWRSSPRRPTRPSSPRRPRPPARTSSLSLRPQRAPGESPAPLSFRACRCA